MDKPRIRKVNKYQPPYALGAFPRETIIRVAGGIVYAMYSRSPCRIQGNDWEQIFAEAIDAEWKPSNVGLDDVQLGSCCWGAKTVKDRQPSKALRVRLISGRNSPNYSYNQSDPRAIPPQELGAGILNIWNERVQDVRSRFRHVRTVVLVKSDDLHEIALFEKETLPFDPDDYSWRWNKRGNLEGEDMGGQHLFTWQPHGSQFTIVESVPTTRVAFKLRHPNALSREGALSDIGFGEDWVEII